MEAPPSGAATSSPSTATNLAHMAAPEVKLKKETPVADFLFGSVAGMVGMLFQFPFDTIKVRLQSQPLSKEGRGTLFRGPLDCFQQAVRKDGSLSLYKGLSAPLVGSMLENSVLFVAFNHIQSIIREFLNKDVGEPLNLGQLAVSGFLSGAVVSFVLTPIELVKCKLQVQDVLYSNLSTSSVGTEDSSRTRRVPFRGPVGVITQTIREHGFIGLYQGHLATFIREAGGGAAWFGAYEVMVKYFINRSTNPAVKTKEDLSPWHIMGAGAVAGMAYNATLFPADCVKSRQQTAEGSASFVGVARSLYKAEGFRGFYRGFGITVARSAPTSALIFATYELMSRHLAIPV
ncbi:uncharacterized protein SPPG_00893 [Spizellomyces punctatus DAOM BR117]|uniref:Uncharacterized protein n=1 Tax=Spizellomyces punctatus (strain DAOM BR117) TaxID=645134 RepID=A0A0L0HQM3_SPIPD|nr:uncharacterized protein SPPG_00893 [Spizellomyces punctatus DAOM BR117]KND03407.1 hypothetical protein SPPG_00893 [Spizellomyces punctatus DAOM BR117]|eukprot:XP_016611446.1 hypothetical protein SPPG_00893 [Spizellomyces punctatus DAOM BR117]